MGDVAMTVPVVYSLSKQYPELSITVLTNKRLTPFFAWMPANVNAVGVDLKSYKGIAGLNRLYKELKALDVDAVADIHDVLRTKYLRLRFKIDGKKVAVIDKGRKEKHELIGHGTDHAPLKPMTERYLETFQRLGFDFPLTFKSLDIDQSQYSAIDDFIGDETKPLVGIAPFAAHPSKIYPLDEMHRVADMLADDGNQVYLFGAGKEETAVLQSWEREGITSVAGKLGGLKNELMLMSRLKVMISMDSSNMHMAALTGTHTISIWGATHPKAGFIAWGQPSDSIIQLPMACRPCSIYGNKPCHLGGCPCLRDIKPEQIVELAKRYGAE